jgi:hypothetical protein
MVSWTKAGIFSLIKLPQKPLHRALQLMVGFLDLAGIFFRDKITIGTTADSRES